MLVLFPFELPFYEQAGVPVTLVGHPLAEPRPAPKDAPTLLRSVGLAPDRETVALVPGSRRGEVERILPALLGAAEIVARRRPEAQFLISRAPGLEPALFERLLAGRSLARVRVHAGIFPRSSAHARRRGHLGDGESGGGAQRGPAGRGLSHERSDLLARSRVGPRRAHRLAQPDRRSTRRAGAGAVGLRPRADRRRVARRFSTTPSARTRCAAASPRSASGSGRRGSSIVPRRRCSPSSMRFRRRTERGRPRTRPLMC